MDLHTVNRVRHPARAEEIASWEAGFAWLAGGTWLFSEPQVDVHTLIDLESLDWPSLDASEEGLEIASTCRVVELDQFVAEAPADWTAAPLFRQCCRSFLSSFKIWNEATVGGNICMSLPAGPMISLTAALEGVCTLWPRGGEPRQVAGRRFRDRQPRECPRARRIAAIDLPARPRAPQDVRVPAVHAHAPRAIRSAADRHALPRARRIRAHDHRRHPPAGSAPLRRGPGRRRS